MIFTYHEVVDQDNPYVYSITRGQLLRHARLFRCSGYALSCTFDDGLVSQYDLGVPALAEESCLGTFFVTVGWIGTRPGYMGWEQVKEVSGLGHRVESHSWSHPFLSTCSDAELDRELVLSKLTLEDKLGRAVQAISAPGGRWTPRVAAACATAGYRQLYISNPWHRSTVDGLSVFGRYMVRRTTGERQLEHLCLCGDRRISGPRLRYELTSAVRRALGDGLYHRLWLRFGSAPAASRHM